LLHQRPRDGSGARFDILALHKENLTLARDQLGVTLDLAFRHGLVLRKSRGRASELETKYLLFLLFGLGSIAVWSASEAVLPAYIIGIVLASCAGKDHFLIQRLHSLPPELCRGQSRRLVFGCS
jgi:hypothetical protein